MAIRPRHCWRWALAGLLLMAGGPVLAQSDPWFDASKAGLQAVDEGRLSEAERLFREALKLSEPFGDADPRRATSVNNLAYILHAQGQYGAAEAHYREALAMRESALGADHPDVAQSCNNLAELYRVLVPGGRIQVADVTIQRPVSEEGKRDIDLWTG